MNQHLKRLIEIVPPPKTPSENGDADAFQKVEAKLGLRLPKDYKDLINKYGSGKWQDFWWLFNPFAESPYSNLLEQSLPADDRSGQNILSAERVAREDIQKASSYGLARSYPHPIYPEVGGILPWALTENGGRFFWVTDGSPNGWKTIYYAGRSSDYEEYSVTCTEIVLGAITGEIPVFADVFDVDFEYGRPNAFTPIKRKQRRSN